MCSRGIMGAHMGMSWGMIDDGGWRKGPWTAEEDRLLIEYVKLHGEGRWNSVARLTGLRRNGKSCRLRWVNYLRPDLKRGQITQHEEAIILELHARWGNRWSTIARSLPGRTDNEIKNYWRTHFKKKEKGSANNNVEKAKNRLLKKQQFQFQQQQQQQQQHEQEFTTMDMKKIMDLLLDDNETNVTTTTNYLPYGGQPDMSVAKFYTTTDTNISDVKQGLIGNNKMGGYNSDISTSSEASNEADLLTWENIWNMEDFQGYSTWTASYLCS